MRSLFGDYEWYADRVATAQAGGRGRAENAERDDAGRFVARDLRREVLDALAAQPRRRPDLVTELRARKASLYQCIRQLLAENTIRRTRRRPESARRTLFAVSLAQSWR